MASRSVVPQPKIWAEVPREGTGGRHEDDPVAQPTFFPGPSDAKNVKDDYQDEERDRRSDADARVLLGGLAACKLLRRVEKQQDRRESAEEDYALGRQSYLPH